MREEFRLDPESVPANRAATAAGVTAAATGSTKLLPLPPGEGRGEGPAGEFADTL